MSDFVSLDKAIVQSFEVYEERLRRIIGDPIKLVHTPGEDSWFVTRFYSGDPRNEEVIASFDFRPSLQCSGIAIPFHSVVKPLWRDYGIASALHEMRIDAAIRASMKLMVATTRGDNPAQVHIMEVSGWRRVAQFMNPRSGHEVVMWVKEL